ncbi:uncharacterized protein METZ01_LOCUS59165, partial [marine metagenome]
VSAHHSFGAQYDSDKPVLLQGIVTRVDWTNPHARFYIDVEDATGEIINWNMELSSPNILKRNGWNRGSLEVGDVVAVQGSMARDGSKMASALVVALADGRRIFSRGD